MKVGDTIKFITSNNRIPQFRSTNNSHSQYKEIKHGNTVFIKNKGIIVAIYPDERDYLISYIDINNNTVCLAFKPGVFNVVNNNAIINNYSIF